MSKGQEKTRRVLAAINHEETDRVPIGEFFWTGFIERCRREMDVGDDFERRDVVGFALYEKSDQIA